MFFDNLRDATMRLEGTIIKYGGKASLVLGITERALKLQIVRLCDGEGFTVGQRDKKVELVPPCLGYVNTGKHAFYAMRKPARMWKQGLSPRNIVYIGRGMGPPIPNEVLAKCLDNDYPSVEKALASFKSTNPFNPEVARVVAFSRHWAVTKNGGLLYKAKNVGQFEEGVPTLDEKYVWLAEYLKECLDEKGC